jgi:nucleotidyltransferase substrate binding protein (TIGR01987 family)
MTTDVPRWQLRLINYSLGVDGLAEAVELRAERQLSELEKAGLVQRFEITWELGWKLMADFLVAELTPPDTVTSASVIRGAFAAGLIRDGDLWMAASKLRHSLTHTYDKALRDAALIAVADRYLAMFIEFRDAMDLRRDGV